VVKPLTHNPEIKGLNLARETAVSVLVKKICHERNEMIPNKTEIPRKKIVIGSWIEKFEYRKCLVLLID
jgi:hypothetical protein